MKRYVMAAMLLALGLSGVNAVDVKADEKKEIAEVKENKKNDSEAILKVLEEGLKEACKELEKDSVEKKAESEDSTDKV